MYYNARIVVRTATTSPSLGGRFVGTDSIQTIQVQRELSAHSARLSKRRFSVYTEEQDGGMGGNTPLHAGLTNGVDGVQWLTSLGPSCSCLLCPERAGSVEPLYLLTYPA